MRLPHRKRIAASALPLVVGLLAGIAGQSAQAAAPRVIADPGGDTKDEAGTLISEPRADIVEMSAGYTDEGIVLRTKTAEPRNPANDANWADGFTALGWAIDVTGDSKDDFQIEYGYDQPSKKIYAEAYRTGAASDAPAVCEANAARFSDDRAYEMVFDPNCFGAPEQFSYAGIMLYTRNAEDPDSVQAEDRSPDGKGVFEGPVSLNGDPVPPPPPPAPAPATPSPSPGGTGQPGPAPTPPAPPAQVAPVSNSQGYWLLGRDGGVFSFGAAGFHGSTGSLRLNQPIVAMASNPAAAGYWFVAADGGIFSYGKAPFFGSTGSMPLRKPIVGMSPTPSGRGYWLVANDGGVFAFGDAGYYGSTGAMGLNRPIVGMAPTASGKGYWLVASDGGIFAFGDAGYYGSTGNLALNRPIVGMAPSPSGAGYWFVASDGGVFAFGDSRYFGSAVSLGGAAPVTGMAATDDGGGYRLVRSDGTVLHYGNAANKGSMVGRGLSAPVVGITTSG